MSETFQMPEPSGEILQEIRESLRLLRELAVQCVEAASINLDDTMDSDQAAAWLKIDKKTLLEKARAGVIPCLGFKKTQIRFHPRTILAKGHSFYARDASRLLK